MSETRLSGNILLDDYLSMVDETWRQEDESDSEPWQDRYAAFIREELSELLGQHGIAYRMIIDIEHTGKNQGQDTPEDTKLRDGIIEELGDLMWFSFHSAHRLGIDPKEACASSLSSYAGANYPAFNTFDELQTAVVANAESIKVPSKAALRYPEREIKDDVSFTEHPSYVLMRMVFRMARALDEGKNEYGPWSASMMEPVPEPAQALGDCINVAAYISHKVLGIDAEDVARHNIDKLQKRALHGK